MNKYQHITFQNKVMELTAFVILKPYVTLAFSN